MFGEKRQRRLTRVDRRHPQHLELKPRLVAFSRFVDRLEDLAREGPPDDEPLTSKVVASDSNVTGQNSSTPTA
jgi:hypothetical protein